MSILDALGTLLETLQGQIISIPTDNLWGTLYVVFSAILLVLAMLFGTGTSDGGTFFGLMP